MSFTKEKYREWLVKRGFECLGKGVYSYVYAKPGSNRCIKVATTCDAWPAYVLWAMRKRYSGTFAPKVYSLKYHNGFYVAVMERLVCTLHDVREDSPSKVYRHTVYHNHARDLIRLGGHDYPEKAKKWIKFAQDADAENLLDDLHQGNFMIRKDGQIVLIDPSSRPHKARPIIKAGRLRYSP